METRTKQLQLAGRLWTLDVLSRRSHAKADGLWTFPSPRLDQIRLNPTKSGLKFSKNSALVHSSFPGCHPIPPLATRVPIAPSFDVGVQRSTFEVLCPEIQPLHTVASRSNSTPIVPNRAQSWLGGCKSAFHWMLDVRCWLLDVPIAFLPLDRHSSPPACGLRTADCGLWTVD
jgi:hypothetical protein